MTDLVVQILKARYNAARTLLRQGQVILARDSQIRHGRPTRVYGYPRHLFDELAKNAGLRAAFIQVYTTLYWNNHNIVPFFIYDEKELEEETMMVPNDPAPTSTENQSFLQDLVLISAAEARLQATGILIGGKLWPYEEATTSPSNELMSNFPELRSVLSKVRASAHVQKTAVDIERLVDKRLQAVLDACLKKLGYHLGTPVCNTYGDRDTKEYYSVNW